MPGSTCSSSSAAVFRATRSAGISSDPWRSTSCRRLGIGDIPAIAQANACDSAALFADGRELITYRLPERNGLPSYGRVVPRVVFDNALAEAARGRGARLEEGLTVSGFERDGEVVAVSVRDGNARRRLRARALIAADGSGSQLARQLHGAARKRDEFLVAARGYFENVDGPQSRCDLSFTSETFPGYAWIFPTGSGQANVGVGMVVETFPRQAKTCTSCWPRSRPRSGDARAARGRAHARERDGLAACDVRWAQQRGGRRRRPHRRCGGTRQSAQR